MARKRIKSLAKEWGIPVQDVIASCDRLKLVHAHSDASLLSPDEADQVKADLDEIVHRNALLRKETVVETSAGTIVEKRLNATVMRRRHAESATASAGEAAQPFHFEAQDAGQEETFVSPFMNESPPPQLDTPVFPPSIEPAAEVAKPQTPAFTAPEVSAPETGQETQIEASFVESQPAPHRIEAASMPSQAPEKFGDGAADMRAQSAGAAHREADTGAAVSARAADSAGAEAHREAARPSQPAREERRDFRRPEIPRPRVETRPTQVAPSSTNGERRTVNLTKTGSHPSAPSLDDGQRGPKVLGKIDLRAKVAPSKPAAPTGRTMGPGRTGQPAGRSASRSAAAAAARGSPSRAIFKARRRGPCAQEKEGCQKRRRRFSGRA